MVEIVVNDNFNEAGEANLFEDIGNGKFESSDLFKLRMDDEFSYQLLKIPPTMPA